jgi:KUP system potassium uptake protein
MLLALGVVYGDIGTSPLYALRECFHGAHGITANDPNILGVLSLVFWSLIALVSVKYLIFVLRADNRGEGGILALMSLVAPSREGERGIRPRTLLYFGIFGAALLYGDAMITPSISVLSAIEGLQYATHAFEPYVVPLTVIVLFGLFLLQPHGTGVVGSLFGPVMVVWFLVIGALGLVEVVQHPFVLRALSPHYGVQFFIDNGWHGYLVLGAVFLVVTGCEALYADMGHFGAKPVRWDWFALVLPSLLLNYFGQGAFLRDHPGMTDNTFYALAPSWGIYPLVILATFATVIASQAVISGIFSITMQAIHLGYTPRLRIQHTSTRHMGQIYIGYANWFVMAASIALVIGFGSSSKLAAAYGVAVSTTMIMTSVLFYHLARHVWKWKRRLALPIAGGFLMAELAFFGANIIKVEQGGWFPLLIGVMMATMATTWKKGRQLLGQHLASRLISMENFLLDLAKHPATRVEGTAVFMTGNLYGMPMALAHNLKHNRILHERVVLLNIATRDVPHVSDDERVEITQLGQGFYRIVAQYGFMDKPSVPEILEACQRKGLSFNLHQTTFFLSRESLIFARQTGMAKWRGRLFTLMARNAQPATAYFDIPPNRVVEIGTQIEF